jgi:hypothetical protein
MADLSKLAAKRKPLGGATPPSMDEASPNLDAPETAPASSGFASGEASALNPSPTPARKIDGRSARRSNRTVQFATRVTPEFDEQIRAIANRDGLLLVEVMEKALAAYEASK